MSRRESVDRSDEGLKRPAESLINKGCADHRRT